jgi:hypothetical protein
MLVDALDFESSANHLKLLGSDTQFGERIKHEYLDTTSPPRFDYTMPMLRRSLRRFELPSM